MTNASHARAGTTETLAIGSHKVTITRPDRVLFPDTGGTKLDLAHYYADVAHWLVPYLSARPIVLERWPGGVGAFSLVEKQAPTGMPEWISTTTQPREHGARSVTYPMAEDASSLTWFVNLASITFHVWMSRVDTIDCPDFLLFDLDPPGGGTVGTLARVALAVRDELGQLGLPSIVKTSGSRGLHVLTPLVPRTPYVEARELNELVALRVAGALPRSVTLERSRGKRPRGAVYLDGSQLARGNTLVPPYVVRARPGALISMPVHWNEVESWSRSLSKAEARESFAHWNMANVPALLAERGDLWRAAFTRGSPVEPALEKARGRTLGLTPPGFH